MNDKILGGIIGALITVIIGGVGYLITQNKNSQINNIYKLETQEEKIIDGEKTITGVGKKEDLLPFVGYNSAMDDHCKMMPEMKGCEEYVALWKELGEEKNVFGEVQSHSDHGTFDESSEGLPEAKKSEIVLLKDGDTYEMVASAVKQEVGNRTIKRLAYNGMIPGPLLQVEKGANITLKFTNNLGFETTLHSHGLRLDDSTFDGVPTTMMGEQQPLKSGESFEYTLNFPDTGVFWYHPHMREDYTQEMGLYGNFHVTEDNYWSPVDREEFLILDDFSEDDVFYTDKINKTLMGRFGNLFMINNDTDYSLEVKTGEKMRLFITNVANTRTFDISISPNMKDFEEKNPGVGYDLEKIKKNLLLVGGDIGRIEREQIVKNQIIAPAERYIVETVFDTPGEYIISSRDRVLGKIIVTGEVSAIQSKTARNNAEDYKRVRENFAEFLAKKADKNLTLTIDMKGQMAGMNHGNMMHGGGEAEEIEWEDIMPGMNEMSTDTMVEWKLVDTDTQKENMDIDWTFKKGDLVKIKIFNDPKSMHPMQHPVHFHGQRFVVLTREGEENKNLQWKDTTLIKNGETIEILVDMSNVGLWMTHCHIAEHLQSGMMFNFRVEE